MNKLELLAPAGNMKSLYAAVQCGANAIYIGGDKFSARAYAHNFTDEDIRKAVEYCHKYEVKIYVTLNIIIKESEMIDAINYVSYLYEIGVDAVIIQDIGFAYLLKNYLPDFEMHASTQMTVHNVEGAKFLNDFGFKRIILSREMSIDEIKYISKDMNIETEIFIHGALCICYSGQCLMSSLIGGRSGNRGRCAQPCRLPYSLINTFTKEKKKGYILSPKDMCTIDNIKEIINSGTSSIKIEGRMKRPEYVAGVVSAYRMAIDHEIYGEEIDIELERKKLLQLFNREGFSKSYLFGNEGKDMMAFQSSKNTGLELGIVQKDLKVKLKNKVYVGDGIGVGEEGFNVSKILKDNKYVNKAFKGETILIFPSNFVPGDILYKTSDNELLGKLKNTYDDIYNKKILLPLKVYFSVGEPMEISTIYDNKNFYCKGDIVEKAINKPLSKERISENLEKTMETSFKFEYINFVKYEEGFLPISKINSIRRDLILNIEKYIKDKYQKTAIPKIKNISVDSKDSNKIKNIPYLMVGVCTKEQFLAAKNLGVENIFVDIFKKGKCNLQIEDIKNHLVYIKIPNIIKGEFKEICDMIEDNISNIKGIITGNLGIINRFKNKVNIIGDYKLNIVNGNSIDFYNKLIVGNCISVELNKKELNDIAQNNNILNCQILLYGKVELMVSEYCPIGCAFGNKGNKLNCNMECMKGTFILQDRKKEEFLLKTDKYCRSYIYNSVPTNIIKYKDEIMKMGFKSFRVDLIDENYKESIKIIKSFQQGKWLDGFENYTRGHYKRGVE